MGRQRRSRVPIAGANFRRGLARGYRQGAGLLALVALVLQLLAPVSDLYALLSAPGYPWADRGLDGSLICHTDGERSQEKPQSPTKSPYHAHDGTCCTWHVNAGTTVPPPIVVADTAFAAVVVFAAAVPGFVPARRPDDVRARSPPKAA